MLKPLNAILFATDLTLNCQQAYEFAVSQSIRFNAVVYILYIIEAMPENVEGRIKGLLGRHRWEDIIQVKEENAHKSLTGKIRASNLLNDIKTFCESVGVDDDSCVFQPRELLISAGDIAETIIKNAKENECDLIVLAARKGIMSRNLIGDNIKSVLKHSPIPVTVVPTDNQ
jgi:nucleotide-binding universal stress UspA family protein